MDELSPFFENQTRAADWRELRIALLRRLASLETGRDNADTEEEKTRIEREIKSLNKQVDKILIEEVSQQFAEDAIRFTIASSPQPDEEQEEDENLQ
jgi:uncharacterized protein (UPF0335 family)